MVKVVLSSETSKSANINNAIQLYNITSKESYDPYTSCAKINGIDFKLEFDSVAAVSVFPLISG